MSVHELTKVFHHHGGDVVHALEAVSFEARPGELVGLVGRSGSGKTTLSNVIAGWSGLPRVRSAGARPSIFVPVVERRRRCPAEARLDGGADRRGEHRVSGSPRRHPRRAIGRHRGTDRGSRNRRAQVPIPTRGVGGGAAGTAIAGPWRCRPACCSPTSPRRTRTRRPRSECSPRSGAPPTREPRSWSRRTTRRSIRHLDRVLSMADGRLRKPLGREADLTERPLVMQCSDDRYPAVRRSLDLGAIVLLTLGCVRERTTTASDKRPRRARAPQGRHPHGASGRDLR